MNKNELIIEIINICDENTRLKNDIEMLKNNSDTEISNKYLANDVKRIIDLAKAYLFEKCFVRCSNVRKIVSDDGEISYTSFPSWWENAFCKNEMPNNFTVDEVRELTIDFAKKEYVEKLAEANKMELKNE